MRYDIFNLTGREMYDGLKYIALGIILFLSLLLSIGIFTLLNLKENKFIEIIKALVGSLIGIILPIIIFSILQENRISKNVEDAKEDQIKFYISQGISSEQVLQNDLPLLDKNRPLTITNRVKSDNTPKLSIPYNIEAFVRNDFIPDDKRVKVTAIGFVKNSAGRVTLFEGFLMPTGQFSKDGRDIFKGDILIKDVSCCSNLVLIKVEGKNRIFEIISFDILPL